MTRTIELELPEELEISDQELREIVAARLFEKGIVSLGKTAEIAGISIEKTAGLLASMNIEAIRYSSSDLETDVANALHHYR